jgi:chemotaxis signal transduction protein
MPNSESSTTNQEALALLEELRARLAIVERLVAPKPVALATATGEVTVLAVQVDGADAAIPLLSVQRVVPYAWLTPIPESPPWVAGLLDLGGRMICVLDVGARIAGRPHCPRAEDFIVICQVEQRLIGLCVGRVKDVVTFTSGEVEPPPSDIPYASYLLGTISHGGSPVLLFSVELLLHGLEASSVMETSP